MWKKWRGCKEGKKRGGRDFVIIRREKEFGKIWGKEQVINEGGSESHAPTHLMIKML